MEAESLSTREQKAKVFLKCALVGFVVIMIATTAGMFYAREQIIVSAGSEQATEDWNKWRDDIRESQKDVDKVVARRVPKGDTNPLYFLMEQNFGACLVTTLLFVALNYAFLSFVIHGSLKEEKKEPSPSD